MSLALLFHLILHVRLGTIHAEKTPLRFHQEQLAGEQVRERYANFWQGVLAAFAEA